MRGTKSKKYETEKYEYSRRYCVPSLVLKEGKEGIIYRVGLYYYPKVHGGGHDWFYWSHAAMPLYYSGSNTLVECYRPTLIALSKILRAPLKELQELRNLEFILEKEKPDYRRTKRVTRL